MKIEEFEMRMPFISENTTIRVMVPNGYESGTENYPVLYVSDGQDVFRDDQTFGDMESLRFEQYYQDYAFFLPEIIIVAIASPSSRAERTKLYSPFSKEFDVSKNPNFETKIEGLGKKYVEWIVDKLKPVIDKNYRTKAEAAFTGICGYSSGALNSIYAGLMYPHNFTRVIAISPAVAIWMDCIEKVFQTSSVKHIKYIYLDTGTNEFGRISTNKQFLEGSKQIYTKLIKRGANPQSIKFEIFQNATHEQNQWRLRFPDAIRWIFKDLRS